MTDRAAPFDIDAYIEALPRRVLSAPRPNAPTRYQVWNYPLLKDYHGFTGTERRRAGQLGHWLIAAGCLTLPERCEICASPGPIAQHGENYYDVPSDPALCRACHRAIHLRFWQWDAWRKIVDASAITGEEWFALTPRHSIDIAGHLRHRWGWRVADIERSPIMSLPDAIAVVLPDNMLALPRLSR
ncbi:hypothetical protein [Novosphingobium sp. Fuku2-ISO-50]|uniref:hypothetical protein n=1 Tax=Novosphingobium sp. Fuku2-ISO-50 TaxID=1739114 RepID=UPI0012E3ABE4|nr:hypothetical protein [Novosphingobium sp. Fuku2-ISO-50]